MKKRLLLLRHAKSSWDDSSLADHDRPLSKRGRKAAAVLGRLFRSEKIRPDLVFVSSALRARETWAELASGAGPTLGPAPPRVEIQETLYHASPSQLLAALRAAPDEANALLLIGHNPGLHEFAAGLVGEADSMLARRMIAAYPTGALAEFLFDAPWSKIENGSAELIRFVTPKELKGASETS